VHVQSRAYLCHRLARVVDEFGVVIADEGIGAGFACAFPRGRYGGRRRMSLKEVRKELGEEGHHVQDCGSGRTW
jgi:hypothetical protein